MTTQADRVLWFTDAEGDWLKIRCRNPKAICESIQEGKTYDLELKLHKEKRSLDANAYAWVLIGKLSQYYELPPQDVYRQLICESDAYEIIPIRDDAVEKWPSIWGSGGLGFVVEDMGASRIKGYHNFRCFYGSHVFDIKQMSKLIDSIIHECKLAGIETMTPEQLNHLLEGWSA